MTGSYDPGELLVLERRLLREAFNPWLRSQITLVTLAGVRGYVREHRRAGGLDHFCLSSGARLGHRFDGDRIGVEAPLVAAPAGAHAAIAAAVAGLDALGRPVGRSPRWSLAVAERAWARARPLAGSR
jgi:hypothetical protein